MEPLSLEKSNKGNMLDTSNSTTPMCSEAKARTAKGDPLAEEETFNQNKNQNKESIMCYTKSDNTNDDPVEMEHAATDTEADMTPEDEQAVEMLTALNRGVWYRNYTLKRISTNVTYCLAWSRDNLEQGISDNMMFTENYLIDVEGRFVGLIGNYAGAFSVYLDPAFPDVDVKQLMDEVILPYMFSIVEDYQESIYLSVRSHYSNRIDLCGLIESLGFQLVSPKPSNALSPVYELKREQLKNKYMPFTEASEKVSHEEAEYLSRLYEQCKMNLEYLGKTVTLRFPNLDSYWNSRVEKTLDYLRTFGEPLRWLRDDAKRS